MRSALYKLHFAVFLWGFTGVLGKAIQLNEGWLVWWRLLISTCSLWVVYLATSNLHKIKWRDFFKIALIGTILSLHWLFFYGSIKYSNISIALTCLSTSGLFSAILEPLFFRRKIAISEIILGLFALGGISIIYFSNLTFSRGIIIGLVASLLTVMVSVLNKKMISDYPTRTITLYQLTGGFLGLSLLMPVYTYLFPAKTMLPTHWDWVWLLILSWCCTLLTFVLYIHALKKVSAFTLNLTLTLEPVYGIILAFLIFHENKYFGFPFYLGFALILAAVILHMVRIVKKSGETLLLFE